MTADIIAVHYLFLYIIISTIGIAGNLFIVYITIMSKRLRSACNVFIGLISIGDALHLMGHCIMIVLYKAISDHQLQEDVCVYWELLPVFGFSFSSMLLLSVALDRVMAIQKY
ncbi:hypothetical protein ANCCEY_09474 [Ancylostoma ceylanicum]|uniref:G-protein coupled receptors family 1 profile domain-containing protein n=1 Tax=Ancylostoma ceylanicum TaxID=53326 RepID=A0A0D6LN12_9BILA|nr:hypothetical protein ANCCEY_09474 [Ancylostoma ceylanicum]